MPERACASARALPRTSTSRRARGSSGQPPWTYRDPVPAYRTLRDHVCVYPSRMDACWLDEERVQAQAGDFYGGWITDAVVGPFKGAAGTSGW